MIDRLLGVITLKAPVYRAIAEDQSATTQAGIIVAIVALFQGFFQGIVRVSADSSATSISISGAIVGAISGLIFGLIGWFVASWILAFVAGKFFNGKTNTGEMLRVTGFVQIFGLISILNVLVLISPMIGCVTALMGLAVAILSIIGYTIGVREAAEFSTTNAIITAIVAGAVQFFIVVIIGGAIVAAIVAAIMLAS